MKTMAKIQSLLMPMVASVTSADSMEASLEDAYILIHEKKISNLQDLLPCCRTSPRLASR